VHLLLDDEDPSHGREELEALDGRAVGDERAAAVRAADSAARAEVRDERGASEEALSRRALTWMSEGERERKGRGAPREGQRDQARVLRRCRQRARFGLQRDEAR
jgi:hypothetical protein